MGFYSRNGGFIGKSYTTDNRGVFDIISHQLDIPAAQAPPIVTDGITHNLDAGDTNSYSSGTTWTDLAGTANFTLSGSPTHVSSSPGHFDFDGSNDYAYANQGFQVNSGSYSLEVWFRTTAGDGELLIASHNNTSGAPFGFTRMIWVGTDDELWFGQYESGSKRTINDTITITDGNWHQVVGVFDGDMHLYRDGNLVGSNTAANGTSDSNVKYWNIGGRRNSGWSSGSSSSQHYINADIAIVRIYWGKGLTSSEVTQNFNAVKGRFGL